MILWLKEGSATVFSLYGYKLVTVWKYDPILNEYYNKKKSEGKHYHVVSRHTEKKLIRIVYSVLKNSKDYYIPEK